MKTKFFTIILFLYALIPFVSQAQFSPISVTTGNADNGLSAHTFTWKDALNQNRTAVMVDQRTAGAGYLRRFTYKVAGTDRICRGTGANGHQGDGYVQNHTVTGGDNSSHSTPGTTSQPLAGNHHSIIDFNMPAYSIDGRTIPTWVQWFFATGRDYPIFSLTQDARAYGGNIGGDSRSPYGDMHYDGTTNYANAYTGDLIGGASWGDTHKWVSVSNGTTNESTLLTTTSGWRYDELNTIPYAMEWTKNINAEQGHVSTLPMSVKDMGRDGSPALTNIQQLNGPMIGNESWSYQIAAYGILSPTGGVTKRLTWGTNFGAIGGFDNYGSTPPATDFTHHGDGMRSNGMLLTYSTWDVFGTHTGGYKDGSVGKMVQQMENMQAASLTAAVGTVVTSGPAGAGLTGVINNVTYTPAGYSPVFATWEVNASLNKASVTLSPAAGKPIENPIFVINNYSVATLTSVKINGINATADVDYFATIDNANNKLWITLNRIVSAATELVINDQGVLPLHLISFSGKFEKGYNLLNWKTENEQNTKSFDIEYSNNAIDYVKVDKVSANGQGNNSYAYKHITAGVTSYYRLKIIDADNNFVYSSIIKIQNIKEKSIPAAISPNPVSEILLIAINDIKLLHSKALLFDINGKQLKTFYLNSNSVSLSMSQYAPGLYVIKLENGETLKIIKQ